MTHCPLVVVLVLVNLVMGSSISRSTSEAGFTSAERGGVWGARRSALQLDDGHEAGFTSGHANARCRDSASVPRFAGCTIRECLERDYDEAELQAGPVDGSGDFPKKLVEGQLSVVTYVCPKAATLEHIARRSQAALRRLGFTVVYSGEMYHNQLPGFTARRGRQWVQVVSEPFDEATGYTVTSVRAVAEETAGRPRPASQRRGRKTTD